MSPNNTAQSALTTPRALYPAPPPLSPCDDKCLVSAGCTVRFTTFMRVVRLLVARTRATTVQYRAQGSGGCSVRPRIGIETHRTPHRTLYVPSGAAVSSVSDSVFSFRPVAAGGAGCWAGEQRPGTAVWRVVRLRPAKVTQPSLVGGRAVRASAAQTPLVELYSGEPALTRDAGCRSASYGRVRNSTI